MASSSPSSAPQNVDQLKTRAAPRRIEMLRQQARRYVTLLARTLMSLPSIDYKTLLRPGRSMQEFWRGIDALSLEDRSRLLRGIIDAGAAQGAGPRITERHLDDNLPCARYARHFVRMIAGRALRMGDAWTLRSANDPNAPVTETVRELAIPGAGATHIGKNAAVFSPVIERTVTREKTPEEQSASQLHTVQQWDIDVERKRALLAAEQGGHAPDPALVAADERARQERTHDAVELLHGLDASRVYVLGVYWSKSKKRNTVLGSAQEPPRTGSDPSTHVAVVAGGRIFHFFRDGAMRMNPNHCESFEEFFGSGEYEPVWLSEVTQGHLDGAPIPLELPDTQRHLTLRDRVPTEQVDEVMDLMNERTSVALIRRIMNRLQELTLAATGLGEMPRVEASGAPDTLPARPPGF